MPRGAKARRMRRAANPDVLSRMEQALNVPATQARFGEDGEPPWLAAMRLVPPDQKAQMAARPERLRFPEDALIKEYYERFPDAKLLLPVDPKDTRLHPVKLFALRQLQHMEAGLSKRDAFKIANRELRMIDMSDVASSASPAAQAADGRRLSAISRVQAQEERVLLAAHARWRREQAAANPESPAS